MPTSPACDPSSGDLPADPCPECGRASGRADDPATSTLLSLAALAPTPGFNLGYGLACFWVALTCSSPCGTCDDAFVDLVVFCLASVTLWPLAFSGHLLLRLMALKRRLPQPRWRWRWLAIPLTFVAWGCLLGSGVLWDVRWHASKAAFAAQLETPTPGRIGLFQSTGAERRSDGSVWFRLGFPDLYSAGEPYLVYSPGREPEWDWDVNWLEDGWWLLTDSS